MNEIILLKYGEIALKGLNKNVFEDILLKNIRWRMPGFRQPPDSEGSIHRLSGARRSGDLRL